LFKNKNYILVACSSLFAAAYTNTYSALLNAYFTKYGMSSNNVALLSLVSNIVGCFNTVFIALWLDKKRNYKKTFIILGTIIFVFQIILTISCEVCKGHISLINVFAFICYTISQACVLAMFTCIFDYSCELCYPAGEGNAIGFMVSAGAIVSLGTVSAFFYS
jgi:Na+/melibiose symporter-like transporter